MKKTLILFINDCLSDLVEKGELVENGYNPGRLFEEVHIFVTNADRVEVKDIQKTVGSADLFLHNFPPPSFKNSLGWQPFLLTRWVNAAVNQARAIRPDLIRCVGFNIHSYLAGKVKQALGIPAVLSLHGNPDVDYLRLARNFRDRYYIQRWKTLAESTLLSFDHVIAVYTPILPYLEQKKVKHYSVIYNLVGQGAAPKTDYAIHGRVKCLTIGRQSLNQKDQRDIIRAVARLDNVELTLVGGGRLNAELRRLAAELRVEDRVLFDAGRTNEALMQTMKDYDLYLYNSINYEISKTVMEAALVGLPVIHNRRQPDLSRELNQEYFCLVENSVQGYVEGIKRLAQDQSLREKLGREARQAALRSWSPDRMEKAVVDLYTSLLEKNAKPE